MAGEQKVTMELTAAFADDCDWVLLRGYCNRSGEIDHLLIGPRGLVAIEVKNHNATVHCDGDEWWFDKYDAYGNLVEKGRRLSDGGRRSPSVQLNESTNELEKFLRSRRQSVSIQRVVIFSHNGSKIGDCRNRKVHIGTSATCVKQLLHGVSPFLDAARVARIEQLVVRDHKYHEGRQRRA